MAKLTTKARKKLPKSDFALPKSRKYPIQDKSHAANAKARAQQQYDKGKLSKDKLEKIDRAANKVLKKEGAEEFKRIPTLAERREKKQTEGKQVKREKEKGMLVKGKAAAKPKNMRYNVKVMEKAGYSPKRAKGAAYGEVGLEKRGREDERRAMLKKSRATSKKK